MSFVCCGVKYSKSDPATYWCIETYFIKPQTLSENIFIENKNKRKDFEEKILPHLKKSVGTVQVIKEKVESLVCKKNGCQKIKITRLSAAKGKKAELEIEEFKGIDATFYIDAIVSLGIAKIQPQVCPIRTTPNAKKIPLVFGDAISPTEQRKKYNMGKTCWADKFKKGIVVDKWVPDIIEVEVANKKLEELDIKERFSPEFLKVDFENQKVLAPAI